MQARLLRWAIERHQLENRSPLLKGAATLFELLTREAYVGLDVDISTDSPTLFARRADGTLVGIDGLSSGTEDQLFLALRLAAAELRLEDATPLPFIADDLFINFDNDRAAAGFEVLGHAQRKTRIGLW